MQGVRDAVYTVYANSTKKYQTTFKNGTGEERMYRNNGKLYHNKYFKDEILDYNKTHYLF